MYCFRHLLVLSALSNARNSSSRSMRDWKSRVLCSNIIIASWKRRSRMFLYFLKSKDRMKVYFAFDDRFVRFTGVVYLIHNTTEIVEQKRPVTSSWVLRSSLNWLNNLKGFITIIQIFVEARRTFVGVPVSGDDNFFIPGDDVRSRHFAP